MFRSRLIVVCLFAIAVAACQFAAASVLAQTAELKLTRDVLAEGIYLLRAPAALDRWTAANIVVVINDDDVTVFDTFTRPETNRMAIAEIRALTSKPVRMLINSHWHMDHWSGNDEFRKAFPGVQIVATEETRRYMTRMGAAFLLDSSRATVARSRAAVTAAIGTGRWIDGSDFTDGMRQQREREIADTMRFIDEMSAVTRVLPTVAFRDEMTFWSGRREFRLINMTGDASGSTVLYLPHEKIIVAGDVLVRPADGNGPPPWTTNSYSIAPWLASLRRLQSLDARVIVPGQGPALFDKSYLTLTADLFEAITLQVQTALERGVFKGDDVIAAVNVDSIGRQFPSGQVGPNTRFERLVDALTRKVLQESLDGVVR